jgi:hypothetical protein
LQVKVIAHHRTIASQHIIIIINIKLSITQVPPCRRKGYGSTWLLWRILAGSKVTLDVTAILLLLVAVVVLLLVLVFLLSTQVSYFPGTSVLEPMVNPTTQASAFRL